MAQKTSPKYRGTYKAGWDVIRAQRFERMKKMGLIGENHKLTPRASKAWDELTEQQKDDEDLKMAVYCAMIDRVDQNLGRLFAKVKELGELGQHVDHVPDRQRRLLRAAQHDAEYSAGPG